MYCGRDFVALPKSSVVVATALPSRSREELFRLGVHGWTFEMSKAAPVARPASHGGTRSSATLVTVGRQEVPNCAQDSGASSVFHGIRSISVKLAPAARAQLINRRPVTGTVTVASAGPGPQCSPSSWSGRRRQYCWLLSESTRYASSARFSCARRRLGAGRRRCRRLPPQPGSAVMQRQG